jgi:hypothetical protein
MNKKLFIGVTLVTATVVGGVVYYRHRIIEQVDQWLGQLPLDETDEEVPVDVTGPAFKEYDGA